jgi:hypothetical protein
VGDLNKADLEGKVVFVRADLNVSLRGTSANGKAFASGSAPALFSFSQSPPPHPQHTRAHKLNLLMNISPTNI